MKTGHKYRIYPTKEQEAHLTNVFGSVRFTYNKILAARKENRMSYAASSRAFTKLRNNEEFPWLKEVQRDVQDRAIRDLDAAYRNFFKKRGKYPAFKRKSGNQSATFRFVEGLAQMRNDELYIPRLGQVKVIWSRELPSAPTQVTISKTASGKYYASFRVEKAIKHIRKTGKNVGIDLGIKTLAIMSDGLEVPKLVNPLESKLKRAQKSLARKQKGSNNRAKQRVKVARIYEKIAHQREDYLHKVTTSLVRNYDVLCMEDLNVRGLVKNHNLAKSISEASFGQFRRMVEYKCKLYGKEFRVVGRFFASSKICSACGEKNKTLTLADREWICVCGVTHQRDVNAARNILAAGLAVSASGASVRPSRQLALKEEVKSNSIQTDIEFAHANTGR